MARDWLRLVLAAAIASAIAAAPVAIGEAAAQTVTKKKAAAKKPAADDGEGQGEAQQKKKQDPAEAQKSIEAALKLIEGGKADAAQQSLTSILSAGNLPPGLMARALLYRGMAHRQLQKPAQAIADLTQALWLKGGLGEKERAEALKQRSGAYADAGLAEPGQSVASASTSPVTTGSNASSPNASSPGWNPFGSLFGSNQTSTPAAPPPAPAAQAPAATSSSGIFGSLFGGAPSSPAKPAPVVVAAPPPAPTVSSWSASTEVRPTTVAMAPTASTPPTASAPQPVAAPVAARPEGKYRVQLGLVRTQAEVDSILSRARRELAPVFEAREPVVDQTVVGNFGAMYRVRVGPYASAADGQAVCGRLKGSGLDCLVVTQ